MNFTRLLGKVALLSIELKGYETVQYSGIVKDQETFQAVASDSSAAPLDSHASKEMMTHYSIKTASVAGYVMIACSVMFVAFAVNRKVFAK